MEVMRLGGAVPVLLCIVLIGGGIAKDVTHEEDARALQELRDLVFENGLQLDGWGEEDLDPCGVVVCGVNVESSPKCNWEGLACLEDPSRKGVARIIGIEIVGNPGGPKLTGQLPSELPPKLKSLSLQDNHLTGDLAETSCVPSCQDRWDNLDRLEIINLKKNNITGKLPGWKGLTKLMTIRLQNNQLTGPIPSSWDTKENLEEIDLSDNRLTGELPENWSALLSLTELKLKGNRLQKNIPEAWFNLIGLELLDVTDNCALCGDVPDSHPFRMLAEGTNLNKPCSSCNGCECDGKSWPVIFENVLYALSVLLVFFLLYLARKPIGRLCGGQPVEHPPASYQNPHFVDDVSKVEMPTLIVMPDGKEICMGKKIDDPVISDDDSSIHFSSTDNESLSSEEDADDINEGKIEDDPRVLQFLMDGPPSSVQYHAPDTDTETNSVVYSSATSALDSDDDGYGRHFEYHNQGENDNGESSGYSNVAYELHGKFPDPPSGPPVGLYYQNPHVLRSHPQLSLHRRSAPRKSISDIPDIFPEPPEGPPQRSAASCEDHMCYSSSGLSRSVSESNHLLHQHSSGEIESPPPQRLDVPELSLRDMANRGWGDAQEAPSSPLVSSESRHPRINMLSPRESVPSRWPSLKRRSTASRNFRKEGGPSSFELSSGSIPTAYPISPDGNHTSTNDGQAANVLLTSVESALMNFNTVPSKRGSG